MAFHSWPWSQQRWQLIILCSCLFPTAPERAWVGSGRCLLPFCEIKGPKLTTSTALIVPLTTWLQATVLIMPAGQQGCLLTRALHVQAHESTDFRDVVWALCSSCLLETLSLAAELLSSHRFLAWAIFPCSSWEVILSPARLEQSN